MHYKSILRNKSERQCRASGIVSLFVLCSTDRYTRKCAFTVSVGIYDLKAVHTSLLIPSSSLNSYNGNDCVNIVN